MGRHSRKAPSPAPAAARPEPAPYEDPYEDPYGPPPGALYEPPPYEPPPYEPPPYEPAPYDPPPYGAPAPHDRAQDRYAPPPASYEDPPAPRRAPEPTVIHRGYAPAARPGARPGGRPEQREPGGAWGANPSPEPVRGAVYGDWRGVPRTTAYAPPPVRDTDTPPFGTPAAGFPRVTAPPPRAAGAPLVPGPREPGPTESEAAPEPGATAGDRPGPGRGAKIRTYTGMAAAAVTTVLAVVVAGQVALDGESAGGAAAAGDDTPDRVSESAASRSDGRPTPASPPPVVAAPAPQLTFEQQMALQLPIDAQLKGPGAFDTVPGVVKAPGKGKVVRYRVDVEQGLGLDHQLFAEAVQRTLNDPRSWAHNGAMTFERVPGGEAEFVITLASPGTTGVWCAKSGLDTTVDNVSCDSASTERVMINAFRWAQGSPTYGADQMLAYRQMLINHEVGHRLGHGHVSCQTPGALAPIMQQQTKSLDINNIQCKANPWVFPGG
ncbi:DUF3152 domain-containing protein [Streptomyces sp. NPDC006512]|uniref:DUF3152 domain-containing protein n=1 Tax=Streptomyces sp. NPDC006512 TaxID=3154307 RepID=UPI00339E1E5B